MGEARLLVRTEAQPELAGPFDESQKKVKGPTAEWNLGDKSRRCHGAKHDGWTATRHPDGTTEWRSPTGRTYTSRSAWQPPPANRKPTFQLHLPSQHSVTEIETTHGE